MHSTVPIHLEGCWFDEPVVLVRAQLPHLSLRGAVLPSLAADRLRLTHSLDLAGLKATGHGDGGTVQLADAHIDGDLDLSGAKLANKAGPALHADGLWVGSDAVLGGLTATGHGENGAVRLLGARIKGQLQLSSAELANDAGPALAADFLHATVGALLDGLKATGHGERGVVQLSGAHIGQLVLSDAELANEAGPALFADGLQVDVTAYLSGLKATGRGQYGAVQMEGAHIGDSLDLVGAVLVNEAGPALSATLLRVGSGALLHGLKATGHGENGGVHLLGARIEAQLGLSDATLRAVP